MNNTKQQKTARSAQSGALATKKKTRKTKNRRGNVKVANNPSIVLSPCALAYAKAKLNPFDISGNGAVCIPDSDDVASMKFSTVVRGEFSVGTTGNIGFVWYSPNSFGNAGAMGEYSQATYALGNLPTAAGAVNTAIFQNVNYPWTIANNPLVRVAASALRVRYVGTELNRGGKIILVQTPGSVSALPGLTLTQITARSDTRVFPCTREWRTMTYLPSYAAATSYDPNGLPGTTAANMKLAILATGTAGNPFEFEVVTYYEAVPYNFGVVGGTSKSHSDPVGYGLVKDYLGSLADGVLSSDAMQVFLRYARNNAAGLALSYFAPGAPTNTSRLLEYL